MYLDGDTAIILLFNDLILAEMTKDDWKLLPNEVVRNKDESSSENTQASERKRRLLHSSKTKTHRRYIQDIVSFLQHEAEAAEEEVQYESKQVASDTVVRVTVGGDSVEARKSFHLRQNFSELILAYLRSSSIEF